MKKHYDIIVRGKVQGVFYRKSTQKKARGLELAGYVKNIPNGTVKMEAEGEKVALESLVDWCYKGPPAAKVSEVKVEKTDKIQEFEKFRIKY